MSDLSGDYRDRIANLRYGLPYEEALRDYQWIGMFLNFCRRVRQNLDTERSRSEIAPVLEMAAKDELEDEELRLMVVAFRQAWETLFGEIVLAAVRWVREEGPRLDVEDTLARISAEFDQTTGDEGGKSIGELVNTQDAR